MKNTRLNRKRMATAEEMNYLSTLEGDARERYAEWLSRREVRECTCEQCGLPYQSYYKASDRFCSTQCELAKQLKRCEQCGSDFKAKRSDARFCSRRCRDASRAASQARFSDFRQ